jgi:hypothetical protein
MARAALTYLPLAIHREEKKRAGTARKRIGPADARGDLGR